MSTKTLKKLIVVDDDIDILLITEIALEDLKGVDIKYCSSAQDAIQLAQIFLPDLMIVDVMMPDMDGIALSQSMKENPALKDIPIVFFTAKIQKNEVDQYLKIGIKDVIIKPFDPLTLSQTILNIWSKIKSEI